MFNKKELINLEDFEIISKIGEGSYADVYLVKQIKKNQNLNQFFAMKVLDKNTLFNKSDSLPNINFHFALNEKNFLQNLSYKEIDFLPSLKYSFQNEKNIFMITQFYQGGELSYHLNKVGRFNEKASRFYLAQLILILEYLHSNNILYRDLKPENVLLGLDGYLNLIDFGLCTFIDNNNLYNQNLNNIYSFNINNIKLGTPQYMSPELIKENKLHFKNDIWSLGIILYQLLIGVCPFDSNNTENIYNDICNNYNKIEYPFYISEPAKKLLKGLITDENKRLSLEEIKKSDFFKDFNWEDLMNKKIKAPFIPKIKNNYDTKYFISREVDMNKLVDEKSENNNNYDLDENLEENHLITMKYVIDFYFNYSQIKSLSSSSLSTVDNEINEL